MISTQINKAIRAAVPLVAVTTPDPWATIAEIVAQTPAEYAPAEYAPAEYAPAEYAPAEYASRERGDPEVAVQDAGAATPALEPILTPILTPVCKLEWDVVRGFHGRSKCGQEWAAKLNGDGMPLTNPVEALVAAEKLPERAILCVHLADVWLREPVVLQAVWNLRDAYKADNRLLVLLSKSGRLPAELSDDVMVFDEPLPGGEQLAAIVLEQHKSAGLPQPAADVLEKAVEALRGCAAFGAEQITAMSLARAGLDVPALWSRKIQQIEQTPGLKVYRDGEESFERIGGCEFVKKFLTQILGGNAKPSAIVFVDEIEKSLGGSSGGRGDTSGVSQDQLGQLLSYMQDHQAAGMIFVGPPGAAKSAIAKGAGNVSGIPTIQLDMGAAKGSLVGQSEQQLRSALKIITEVSNGQSLWIATCNSIAELPPELRRRFTLGTFFFDLPGKQERESIWDIWLARYELFPKATDNDPEWSNDEGWTGAEIRQCCDIAWRLGCRIDEAAAFVVPVSRSASALIERLREQADGKFLSASYPGVFRMKREAPKPESTKKRGIKLE